MAFKIPESLLPSRRSPLLAPPPISPTRPRRGTTRIVRTYRPNSAQNSPTSNRHPPAEHIPRRIPASFRDLDNPTSSSVHHQGSSRERSSVNMRRPFTSNQTSFVNTRQSVNRAANLVRRRSSSQTSVSNSSANSSSSSGNNTAKASSLLDTAKRLANSRRGTLKSKVDNRFTNIMPKRKVNTYIPQNENRPAVHSMTKRSVKKESEMTKKPPALTPKAELSRMEVVRQLKRLRGNVCEDDYAKYRLLDERDKTMCKGRVKHADVENATVTQGTCADMCPEKERYLRVVQKRVSIYECNSNGDMVPELTVKDYSRSAADQEEPLPHDLRPSDVLQRTMNYLISRIAEDIPSRDEELAQWYDFLWNRTRAIRKDLTQQMLINETAVSLVEQCTRFHIFVAHRLCELGLNEFDQRMNAENLTKSLQSLRYLYDDLGARGLQCATEAEFRSYDVLLNLTDSNILREVLTYRRDIRESPDMRLAIRLFSSFRSGNYVRFFRLLKTKASYLQSCLCHRYFLEVRSNALYVLTNSSHESHRPGTMTMRSTKTNRVSGVLMKYPLSKLTELLGFDDVTQASTTLGLHGVYMDGQDDEQNVILSKASFYLPDEPIAPKIHAWIEAKRGDDTITQVLCGGVPVVVDLPKATVSFNDSGTYVLDPVLNAYLKDEDSEEEEGEIVESESSERTANFTFKLPKHEAKAEPTHMFGQDNAAPRSLFSVKQETDESTDDGNGHRGLFSKLVSQQASGNMGIGAVIAKTTPQSFSFALPNSDEQVKPASSFGQFANTFASVKREPERKGTEREVQRAKLNALLSSAAEDAFNTALDQIIKPRCKEVLMSTKITNRHKQAQQAAHERKRELSELCQNMSNNLSNEVVLSVVDQSARKHIRQERRSRSREVLQKTTKALGDKIMDEVLNAEVDTLCVLSVKENVLDVRIRLKQISANLNRLWLKQFFDAWRCAVEKKLEKGRRQYEVLELFPTVLQAHSKLRAPKSLTCGRLPFVQNFSSILIEQKVNRIRAKRIKRIVKCAFNNWRKWTRLRIDRKKFAAGFARNSMKPWRKRRWTLMSRTLDESFGLRQVIENEEERRKRKFGPRLSDLLQFEGEVESVSTSRASSPPPVASTPMGKIAPEPNFRSFLNDIRIPMSRIGTPSRRSLLNKSVSNSTVLSSRRSLPESGTVDFESIEDNRADSIDKSNALSDISQRVDEFMRELNQVSQQMRSKCHRAEDLLNDTY